MDDIAYKDDKWLIVFEDIYRHVFKRLQENTLDIFLCGGASTKKLVSTRDKLKKELEKLSFIRVLYPEDLFIDILNLDKKHNLLSLEKFLAENCDIICIVCESTGSFAELGAFTNNSQTFEKVIALIQSRYKKHQSFIMLGPIKYIETKNKDNVIYYNSHIDEAAIELKKLFRKYRVRKYGFNKLHKELNTITGFHLYILLVLFFIKDIEVDQAVKYFKRMYETIVHSEPDFSLMFRSSIKLLYKERLVEQYSKDNKKSYALTSKGYKECLRLFSTIPDKNTTMLCDKIRLSVLNLVYY